MRWSNLFVCDQIFRPSKNDFDLLCDSSQMKAVIKERLDALDDDKLFNEYLSNQATFEQVIQLCIYAISFEGRDTSLVIKSANLLKEILVNIWNRQETDRSPSPSAASVQLTRLSLGEYLMKMFEGSCRLHPCIPVFVLYDSSYYTKLILKYLVYAFVPVTHDYLLFEQQSKMCVDLLMLIFEIVSISESSIISRYDPNVNVEQIMPRKDSLLVYDRNVVVDDELLHFITDFFVVSIANWSCQRIQYYTINTYSTQMDHVVSYLFGSIFHVWFNMSIRAFPVSTQWKNLRNLLFMNLYRPSAVREWSKLMIFITRLFVMKLTIDCEQDLISLIHVDNECERVAFNKDESNVFLKTLCSSNFYNSSGAASTFRELFLSSPVSRTLAHSTTVLQLWFRFLFLLDDPSYFMNHSHYFQESFIITDRDGVLDFNNSMIETCAHINKNNMNNYMPLLEKYLPITFNHFMSTIEVIMNTLFFNQNIPISETDASLESLISPARMYTKRPQSQISDDSINNRDKKPQMNSSIHASTVGNQLTIQPTNDNAFPSIWVSPCVTNRDKEATNIINDASSFRPTFVVDDTVGNDKKGRLSFDNSQIKNSSEFPNHEFDQLQNNNDMINKTRTCRGRSAVFNMKASNLANTSTTINDEQKVHFNEFLQQFSLTHTSTEMNKISSATNDKRSSLGDTDRFSGDNPRAAIRKTCKALPTFRSSSVYSNSGKKTQLPLNTNIISVGDYDYSMSSDRYELGGFNMEQLVKDVNIRLCLAGQVKADSIVKIINPWLTNFLVPSFNSNDSQIAYQRFLLEKACILLTSPTNPIYTSSGGLISRNSASNIENFNYNISLLCGPKDGYAMTKNSIFQRILLKTSLINEDWIYLSKPFPMKNNYEPGRAIIIKLICYLLCDFATSCKMSTQNLVNMYTLVNIGMCYQLNNSSIILSKVVQYLNIFFQSDLRGSYMLTPMTYNAICVILTCDKFNPQFVSSNATKTHTTLDESISTNASTLTGKYDESPTADNANIDLKHNALKALLSLLNFPFHEYSLLFNIERLKTNSNFTQLILLSQKFTNNSDIKYLFVNSSLVEIILHTLRVFVSDAQLSDSNHSILFSCISLLFWNCVAVQQKLAQTNPPSTTIVVTEFNYKDDTFSDHIISGGGVELANIMPKDCIESKDIFKMSVEVVTEVLNEISTRKQFDFNVAISVVNFVSTFSTVNVTFVDKEACLRLVIKLCNFIHVQANKAPIYHNKQLHSTILATFQCISKWVLLQPWIMDESHVRNGVLAVVELGIFGQVAENYDAESFKTDKIKPSIKVRQSISFRVGEMAETVIQLLASSRHHHNNSISQYHHINEETVLQMIQSSRLKNKSLMDKEPQFVYFIYQKSIIISFIEFPYCAEEVNDGGESSQLIKPLGLIICRSACGKKVFEVEFDPVGNTHTSSYMSSLRSYDDALLEAESENIGGVSNIGGGLEISISPPQARDLYCHFPSNNKEFESLIPYNLPTYENMSSNYISKELFQTHIQRESHVYKNKTNVSYLQKCRFKHPPEIHHKYNTLKMFLAQMNIVDPYSRRNSPASSGSIKPSSFHERYDPSDQTDTQQSLISSTPSNYDYKQLKMITTSDTVLGKELLQSFNHLDNISNRRTETVLVFYVKQRKVSKPTKTFNVHSPTSTMANNISLNNNSTLFPDRNNANITDSDKSSNGEDDTKDRLGCGKLFNNFLDSIGICVNSNTHKKWAGNKNPTETRVNKYNNYDFIYREDWTCETAVIVDSWIPLVPCKKSPSTHTTIDDADPKDKRKNTATDRSQKFSKSIDVGKNLRASGSAAAKRSISDIFAVVWLDNFDHFEFLRIDQMVAGLMSKSGLHPKNNTLSYVIFLRHMKNGLICIHTFYKSEFLWKPYNNSSIPSGLIVHPDNLTTILFNGINSIGILKELTQDHNIDPFSKRKHFIQQFLNELQQRSTNNLSECVDWLDFP